MLWLYLRVPRLPSPFSKHCCHCWPLLLSCCGRGRCGPLLWPHCCSAVAAQSFLRVPRLPPSKPPTLRCSFLPLLAVSFGAVALSSGSDSSISFFKTLLPLLAPAAFLLWPWPLRSPAMAALLQCCGRPIFSSGSETAQLPSTASCVFWCCGSIFGFRDCHLLFQNIAATAGPCCCGRGRCGPCCPSCCGRGRCGPLLWPHCCSAVAAQSFLRVPRLPPAPLKTSDPSLQLPSTASCVFWCCGSIFGFRDCHVLFQNIAATAGPGAFLLWPWPLRSPAMAALLQCCGRLIFSSGSETAACPPQNLRPFAAASFHC